MSREAEVLEQLRTIVDPDLGKDIVSLGFIKELLISDNGKVSFTVELTTPACPVKEQFRVSTAAAVRQLPWVTDVLVNLSARARPQREAQSTATGLARVKHIIGVASCKGGVGKSTVAVNLAFTLHAMGAKVGIFDADVYGPSLPTMVHVDFEGLYQQGGLIVPVLRDGIKLMSFGYANPDGGPAVMRGPMVTNVVNQLLTTTDWGDLDYLVLDMPPGTGDIQITLCQAIPITAVVMVTTPQQISFVDVVKGLMMFDKLKVPTVAVVENMSYFQCSACGTRHDLFGRGARDRLVNEFGIRTSYEVPLVPAISVSGDAGTPAVAADPDGEVANVYREIAAGVVREVSKVVHGGLMVPAVEFVEDEGVKVTWPGGETKVFACVDLRLNCRAADNWDHVANKPRIAREDLPATIAPVSIRPMGNYAVVIHWSDEHESIYPYETLARL